MNLSHTLPQDELQLARLTAAKLARVMHGLMSVGTASLEMASPTDFLAGREQVPLGFLEVLRCVGVKPGHADKVELLRQPVQQLTDLARQFHGSFLELAHWRSLPPEDLHAALDRLGDCYLQFCRGLETFCSLLGMEANYSDQARQDRALLEGFFQTLPVPQAAPTT